MMLYRSPTDMKSVLGHGYTNNNYGCIVYGVVFARFNISAKCTAMQSARASGL